MREATRLFKDELNQGWDMVFIARAPISDSQFRLVKQAVEILLRRACLLGATGDDSIHP
jgi:ribonuclease P protein component